MFICIIVSEFLCFRIQKGGKMTTLNYEKQILVIVLPPFDLGQLLREDNGLLNKTYVYTYDNAGNIIYA